ncbi:DNA cytosine methyltransferase [Microvirga mediterraneensis]|uniref:Cytosine-specific methyltransferase n=1 Tax=Microvirga mediterraneensis TaxID=2754695 RepID=A0A838BS90_9HYPH|nr:DNA (cytosine-5-)-methyltransferase [Microvirga mediterraneensis]MBA1158674.1 DNA (cytosine-5-)-methyltransferase [Microvirga mediterraneensis]
MKTTLNVTAVFGGIGGMELGLHRSGHVTTLFCENDPEATAVLAHRFRDIRINFDVRKTEALVEDIDPASNLLTAGFPCTDLSQAGRMQGFQGAQSSLVRKVFDLLDARPFPRLLIENVPNWRVLHGGQYMTEVVEALEARGYRWAYRVIDARAFGLPQRRLRVFLYATQEGDPRDALLQGDEAPDQRVYGLSEAAHGFYWTEGNKGLGWGEDCIPTLKGGSAIGIPAAPAVLMPDGKIITPDLRDGERLQGFESGWTDVDTVLPQFGERRFNQRKRWLLIGNAVNVEVAAWIGERLAGSANAKVPEGTTIEPGSKWPAAAWFDGRVRRRVDIGTWPVNRSRPPLASFLIHGGQLLSRRATNGFHERILRSPLRITKEFKDAVRLHLARMEQHEGKAMLAAAE